MKCISPCPPPVAGKVPTALSSAAPESKSGSCSVSILDGDCCPAKWPVTFANLAGEDNAKPAGVVPSFLISNAAVAVAKTCPGEASSSALLETIFTAQAAAASAAAFLFAISPALLAEGDGLDVSCFVTCSGVLGAAGASGAFNIL